MDRCCSSIPWGGLMEEQRLMQRSEPPQRLPENCSPTGVESPRGGGSAGGWLWGGWRGWVRVAWVSRPGMLRGEHGGGDTDQLFVSPMKTERPEPPAEAARCRRDRRPRGVRCGAAEHRCAGGCGAPPPPAASSPRCHRAARPHRPERRGEERDAVLFFSALPSARVAVQAMPHLPRTPGTSGFAELSTFPPPYRRHQTDPALP